MLPGNHRVFCDEAAGVLHLSLECRDGDLRQPSSSERCARELDAWLLRWGERPLCGVLVGTFVEHHGDLAPVVDVLVRRRPRLSRLGLGAFVFPDFDRGDYVPDDDRDRDGSSWSLETPSLGRLLNALPSLEELVVHTTSYDESDEVPLAAPALRRLIVRTSASERAVAALGKLDAPALETLEIWNPDYAYGWGGGPGDLAPLLNNTRGTPGLRRVALVTDVGDALIDVLADGALLPRLAALDLSHGTVGDDGARVLRRRRADFAHLKRLVLTGNGLGREQVGALRREQGDVVVSGWQRSVDPGGPPLRCAPPAVSMAASLFDGWPAR